MNCHLEFHTDQPYLPKPPGILLLHCLTPAPQGGENMYMDAFTAAMALKRDDPAAYRVLLEEPATYTDRKVGWYIAADHRTLEESAAGELQRIVFNGRRRDSWAQAAAGRMTSEEFYRAYTKLAEYIAARKTAEGLVHIKAEAGEIMCMDNNRVVHSRKGFSGFRYMCSTAFDWTGAVAPFWRARQARAAGPPGSPGA